MEPFTHKFSDVRQLLLAEGMVIQHKPVLDEYRVTVSMASIGEKYPDLAHPAKVEKAEAIAYYTPNLRDAYETGLRMSAEFHQQVHLPQKETTMNDAATNYPSTAGAIKTQTLGSEPASRFTELVRDRAALTESLVTDTHSLLCDLSTRLAGGTPATRLEPAGKAEAPIEPNCILDHTALIQLRTNEMLNRCLDMIGHINGRV